MENRVVGLFKSGGKGCKVWVVVENILKSSACERTFCINHRFNCDSLGVDYTKMQDNSD